MSHWSEALASLGACPDSIAWAAEQPDFATAWATCDRADWLLWLGGRLAVQDSEGHRALVRAAVSVCQRVVLYEDWPLPPPPTGVPAPPPCPWVWKDGHVEAVCDAASPLPTVSDREYLGRTDRYFGPADPHRAAMAKALSWTEAPSPEARQASLDAAVVLDQAVIPTVLIIGLMFAFSRRFQSPAVASGVCAAELVDLDQPWHHPTSLPVTGSARAAERAAHVAVYAARVAGRSIPPAEFATLVRAHLPLPEMP